MKAAYLYNFAKYAEWPEQSLASATAPFTIGVVSGDDEFLDALKQTVVGKSVGPHPIVVKRVSVLKEMDFCQLIFFRSSAGRKQTENAIAALTAAQILLVGEDDNFLPLGGEINLVLKNGTVRYEISKEPLDRAGIRLSPALLAAAIALHGAASESTPALSSALASGSTTESGGESRRLKVSTLPEYPEVARRMNIRGTAQVEVTVARDGSVTDVRIIGGHPMLTDALVKAVRGWRYEPAKKESHVVVKFVFDQ